jgi:RHS repeat-associated protein
LEHRPRTDLGGPARRQSEHGSQTTRYAYDGFNLAAVYDGNNHLIASYVTQPTGADVKDVAAPAEVVERTDAAGTAYFVHDGSNSTTALTDATGAVTSRYRYNTAGLPASSNGPETGYTWDGGLYDTPTGLYYLNDRYYDPTTGRFISEDPAAAQYYSPPLGRWTHQIPQLTVTNPVSFNRYAYAGNDAVGSRDPSGDDSGFDAVACVIAGVLVNGDDAVADLVSEAECASELIDDVGYDIEVIEIFQLMYKGDWKGALDKALDVFVEMELKDGLEYAIEYGFKQAIGEDILD